MVRDFDWVHAQIIIKITFKLPLVKEADYKFESFSQVENTVMK